MRVSLTDPGFEDSAAAWPPPYSRTFLHQARSLLDVRPVLTIVGPVGANRRRLAVDIAELATSPGTQPLTHAGRYDQLDQPHSALRHLFPQLTLPTDSSPAAIEMAVRGALRRQTDNPPVIVLSDTDLCDPQSIATLIRAANDSYLMLVATLTPEAVPQQPLLLTAAEVIDVPPLDEATIGALLRARFGVRAHPLLVALLAERTGGSYSAVRDIADASFEAGLIVVVEDVLVPRPGTTADNLVSLRSPSSAERLGGGEEITDLVQLVALLGQLDVDDARACVPPEVVDLALAHGTFMLRDVRLVFVSRAESVLVQRSVEIDRRRDLFEKYAHILTRTLALPGSASRAADWWLAVNEPLPVELAVRAARDANLAGRHDRAIVYTDPENNAEHADVAPVERAFALAELDVEGDPGAHYAEVDAASLTEEALLVYLRGISRIQRSDERERLTQLAVESADPEVRRRLTSVRALADLVDRAFDTAGDDAINRLRSLAFSAPLSPSNRAVTFATLSAVLRQSGRPVQAVEAAEFALKILSEQGDQAGAFHLNFARELHIMALISAIDADGAERAIANYANGPYAHHARSPMTTALETSLAMLQGDLERALASARLCLASLPSNDPHQIRGWVEAMLTQILVLRSRHQEARSSLSMAEAQPAGRRQLDLERRMMLAWTHDALAEPEEALRLLAEAADEARTHGLRLALIDATAMSVQIGGPPHLPVLLSAVDDLVDPSGVPLVWQTFARSAHRGDLASLIALAELADSGRARRFAAEVARYVLDTWRRRTDMDAQTKARLEHLADPEARPGNQLA